MNEKTTLERARELAENFTRAVRFGVRMQLQIQETEAKLAEMKRTQEALDCEAQSAMLKLFDFAETCDETLTRARAALAGGEK